MWSLRRASTHLKFGRASLPTAVSASKLEVPSYNLEGVGLFESSAAVLVGSRHLKSKFYHSTHHLNYSIRGHSLSSQAGAETSGEEDDLEDGFSELEHTENAKENADTNAADDDDDELISDTDLSGDADVKEASDDEQELFDEADTVVDQKKLSRTSSELLHAILAAPGLTVHKALDKWIEDGKDLSRTIIASTMLNLRKRRMYGRALQFSEWLESKKQLEFGERDYASRVDLIAKVGGIQKAERYIQKVPESFRGEVVYRTLLANCVASHNTKKAEDVFNKMKDLELPITAFSCNQLLLLYKRHDKKKIADVLLLMERENVKPTLFTYKILIDVKGLANDMTGMDQVVETMKAEGIEPDLSIKSVLAKHYAAGGLTEKAEELLKDMEDGNLKENRWACRFLLPIYGSLGKPDEVRRIWDFCQHDTRPDEFRAAIEAWGKLKEIKEAEAVFEKMMAKWKKPTSRQFSSLLKVYTDNKMLEKGKDLVKRMGDSGCKIGPFTWDALVKLYVEAGEVGKAESLLQKATQKNQTRPMFISYMAVMDAYAKEGDVHNTEKLFYKMKQVGYVARMRQFQCLVQAYIKAKVPAYGIRERMKADNIFPNKSFAGQLSQVDAFRRTAVSDLLD